MSVQINSEGKVQVDHHAPSQPVDATGGHAQQDLRVRDQTNAADTETETETAETETTTAATETTTGATETTTEAQTTTKAKAISTETVCNQYVTGVAVDVNSASYVVQWCQNNVITTCVSSCATSMCNAIGTTNDAGTINAELRTYSNANSNCITTETGTVTQNPCNGYALAVDDNIANYVLRWCKNAAVSAACVSACMGDTCASLGGKTDLDDVTAQLETYAHAHKDCVTSSLLMEQRNAVNKGLTKEQDCAGPPGCDSQCNWPQNAWQQGLPGQAVSGVGLATLPNMTWLRHFHSGEQGYHGQGGGWQNGVGGPTPGYGRCWWTGDPHFQPFDGSNCYSTNGYNNVLPGGFYTVFQTLDSPQSILVQNKHCSYNENYQGNYKTGGTCLTGTYPEPNAPATTRGTAISGAFIQNNILIIYTNAQEFVGYPGMTFRDDYVVMWNGAPTQSNLSPSRTGNLIEVIYADSSVYACAPNCSNAVFKLHFGMWGGRWGWGNFQAPGPWQGSTQWAANVEIELAARPNVSLNGICGNWDGDIRNEPGESVYSGGQYGDKNGNQNGNGVYNIINGKTGNGTNPGFSGTLTADGYAVMKIPASQYNYAGGNTVGPLDYNADLQKFDWNDQRNLFRKGSFAGNVCPTDPTSGATICVPSPNSQTMVFASNVTMQGLTWPLVNQATGESITATETEVATSSSGNMIYLTGNTTSSVIFGTIPQYFTICTVSAYTAAGGNRIVQADDPTMALDNGTEVGENHWVHGHYGGSKGVVLFGNRWVTSRGTSGPAPDIATSTCFNQNFNGFASQWVIMCTSNAKSADTGKFHVMGFDTNANIQLLTTSTEGDPNDGLGGGVRLNIGALYNYTGGNSNWALFELRVWNGTLSRADMNTSMLYMKAKLSSALGTKCQK